MLVFRCFLQAFMQLTAKSPAITYIHEYELFLNGNLTIGKKPTKSLHCLGKFPWKEALFYPLSSIYGKICYS